MREREVRRKRKFDFHTGARQDVCYARLKLVEFIFTKTLNAQEEFVR